MTIAKPRLRIFKIGEKVFHRGRKEYGTVTVLSTHSGGTEDSITVNFGEYEVRVSASWLVKEPPTPDSFKLKLSDGRTISLFHLRDRYRKYVAHYKSCGFSRHGETFKGWCIGFGIPATEKYVWELDNYNRRKRAEQAEKSSAT